MTLVPLTDATPALWVREAIEEPDDVAGLQVRHVVPGCFERYARVFHHWWDQDELLGAARSGRGLEDGSELSHTWAEATERSGRVAHPLMQWPAINAPFSVSHNIEGGGGMGDEEMRAVVEALRPMTGTPDRCLFMFWEGHSGLDLRESARLELLHTFHLFEGPIEAVFDAWGFPGEDPTMLWPDDRSWFVGRDIDSSSTLIGGSAESVERVLGQEGLEAMEVAASDRIDVWGNEINDLTAE